jgi:DDE superfamily endonuclease
MEDVLKTYEKPLSEREPVICVDEKPVVLHEDTRPPIPMQPGQVTRRDYEYKRCGTANVFCGIEPKAGVHFTKVTPTRSSPEFADFLLGIAEHYPAAHTIHLVMDNLSSHTRRRWWTASAKRTADGCGSALPCTTRPSMEAG